MCEGGLLRCEEQPPSRVKTERNEPFPSDLTWEGHEYLDSIRNPRVWKRLQGAMAEHGGGLSMDVMKTLATKIIVEILTK